MLGYMQSILTQFGVLTQATRAVIEPALRRRLKALYPNVQLRSGCWVKGVSHGSGGDQGSVTGDVEIHVLECLGVLNDETAIWCLQAYACFNHEPDR